MADPDDLDIYRLTPVSSTPIPMPMMTSWMFWNMYSYANIKLLEDGKIFILLAASKKCGHFLAK